MTKTTLIAAIDERGGLGKENQLMWHLPADFKHFKALTMGKPIIMGRKTYASIGRPLPGRLNIVLSKQSIEIPGVSVVKSIEEAFDMTGASPERIIIGGALIYNQTISLADCIHLTVVHHTFDADVFFPVIDKTQWILEGAEQYPCDDNNQYDMTFNSYQRK